MPSQTFSSSSIANAPIDSVWASIDDAATWESVSGIDKVTEARHDYSGKLTDFHFDTHVAGVAYKGEAKAIHREEGRAISWHVENSEISGVTKVELSPSADNATEIKVTLEVSSKGMLAGMFFPQIAKTIGDSLPESVEQMAARYG